jgi:hypothetical protein
MYQMIEILKYGDFDFPLKNTKTIMDIKLGLYEPERVSDIMEELTLEVRELMQHCKLPSEVDRAYWEDFIVRTYRNSVTYE